MCPVSTAPAERRQALQGLRQTFTASDSEELGEHFGRVPCLLFTFGSVLTALSERFKEIGCDYLSLRGRGAACGGA